jgi:hypothetical protein
LSSAPASSSSQPGAASVLRTAFLAVLALTTAVCLIAPNQVDDALQRFVPTVGSKRGETNEVWKSVLSAMTGGQIEGNRTSGTSVLSGATVLQPNERIATGSAGHTVLTRGHDILQVGPESTVAIGDSGPDGLATIIELISGTVHVEAAERTGDETLSIETRFLVATVKGTTFDVTIAEDGAAVTVTEGVVAVRATGSGKTIDVTVGNTAVVASTAGAPLVVTPTPAGGAAAAIEAANGRGPNAN